MTPVLPDPRRYAWRDDIAARNVVGLVPARRVVDGSQQWIGVPHAPLLRSPAADAAMDSEALFGEAVIVYECRDGYSWGQLGDDGYVGYLPQAALTASAVLAEPTHLVAVAASYCYPAATIKARPCHALPLGARLVVSACEGEFSRIVTISGRAYIRSDHLRPLDRCGDDYVAVAHSFCHRPYLWGGKTGAGIDCSGLVQISLQQCGIPAPRDSDMQEDELGHDVAPPWNAESLRRGDLVFWPGHVAVMTSPTDLLHATAATMLVVEEPFAIATARIAAHHAPIRRVKRLSLQHESEGP